MFSCCTCICFKIFGLLGILALALKVYIKLTTGWCKSQTCLKGKTVIVTGANTGIGFESALDFAKRGARVILACRDEARAEHARSHIVSETGNDDIIVRLVDFESLESVRNFARTINETEPRLDILVNNAGAGGLEDQRIGPNHLQLLMLVNYYASFLLTNLLLSLMKKTGTARVVNVSSMVAQWAVVDLNNLDGFISKNEMYFRSKLCNILFTVELARKLKGSDVTTYSLHPGAVSTEIMRHMPPIMFLLFKYSLEWFFKTPVEGAQTTIYCAVEKDLGPGFNGQHFADCHYVERYKSVDLEQAKPLWDKTEELVGLKENERQY